MFDLFTSTSSSRLNAKKESKSISKQSSLSAATSSLKDEDAGSESALQRQFFINLSMKNK